MGKIEQLELAGILSENVEQKNTAEKLKNTETGSVSADEQVEREAPENKMPLKLKKVRPGSGLLARLKKESSDPKKQAEIYKRFKKIQDEQDYVYNLKK